MHIMSKPVVRIESRNIGYGKDEYRAIPINHGTMDNAYAALRDVRDRLTRYGYTFQGGGMGGGFIMLTDRGYTLVALYAPFSDTETK